MDKYIVSLEGGSDVLLCLLRGAALFVFSFETLRVCTCTRFRQLCVLYLEMENCVILTSI
jgi:hypothetical protein